MISAVQEVVVAHHPARVFESMTNPRHAIRWISSLFDYQMSAPGPPAVGMELWCTVKLLGRRIRVEGRYTAYQPPAHCVISSTMSPFAFRVILTCTPVAEGSLARMQIDLDDRFFIGVRSTVVVASLERMIAFDLGSLSLFLDLPPTVLTYLN